MSRTNQTKQIHEKRMFKSSGSETKCAWHFLQYPEIHPKSTNFFCLFITVLCYAVGNIPITVYLILNIAGKHRFMLMKYVWIVHLADALRVAGSHTVNPLIYEILDKRLLTFWKLCRKKKQKTQGN